MESLKCSAIVLFKVKRTWKLIFCLHCLTQDILFVLICHTTGDKAYIWIKPYRSHVGLLSLCLNKLTPRWLNVDSSPACPDTSWLTHAVHTHTHRRTHTRAHTHKDVVCGHSTVLACLFKYYNQTQHPPGIRMPNTAGHRDWTLLSQWDVWFPVTIMG